MDFRPHLEPFRFLFLSASGKFNFTRTCPNVYSSMKKLSKKDKEAQQTATQIKLAAANNNLTPDETVLAAVCEAALHIDIDHIAAVCRQARVPQEQVELHGSQIGAHINLRPAMVASIRRFVQFFLALEKLQIVELKGAIPNRALFGYHYIKILQPHKWASVIHCACDVLRYFGRKGSMVTVYEKLLDFGYGPVKYNRSTAASDCTPPRKTPTQKKRSLLLHTPCWSFNQAKLDRNVKRYTNGHIKSLHPFDLLVQVACEAGEA